MSQEKKKNGRDSKNIAKFDYLNSLSVRYYETTKFETTRNMDNAIRGGW
jgi:hypothetical protein